ncbi:DUF2306 domain-containing protein [Chitinophaga sancti]|uniref:DUF2306 domain-containing protein n=1 Tax=Chitinophaga sancti TaxID=1004 RepID=UPI003F7AB6D6
MKKGGITLLAAGILFATWLLIRLSIPYLAFDPYTDFLMTKQRIYHILHWRFSFYVHVFISFIVMITGLLQFSWYVIKKYPGLHRRSGTIYAVVVLFLSGPSGLVMAFYANGGLPARISFVLLALLWLYTTAMGWYYARQHRWMPHGAMMLRSYALTLSAVSLRLYAYLIDVLNIPLRPHATYMLIAWLSWTLNLLIAELIIRKIEKIYPVKQSHGK